MYKKLLTATAVSIALSGCLADDNHGAGSAVNTVGVVTIAGDVDGTLYFDTIDDANGYEDAAGVYTYQWYDASDIANIVAIDGETSDSYTVDPVQDAGKDILLQVSYTDDDGNAESPGAKMTIPDNKTGYITFDNDVAVGETITAKINDGDGADNIDYDALTFVWTGITGTEVGEAYTILEADLGSVITVSVDYTDDVGFTNTATIESDAVTEAVATSGPTNVAAILDTQGELRKYQNLITSTDGGELRIKLADSAAGSLSAITSGRLTASIIVQEDVDTVVNPDDADYALDDDYKIENSAYVTLYGSGTSSSNYHGDVQFASDSTINWRDDTGGKNAVSDAPDGALAYTEGEVIEYVMTWDATTYSFSIDGGTTFYGPYDTRDDNPVTVISFKLGDTKGESTKELLVDNIEIYDVATKVFSDDFELTTNAAYIEGYDLDGTTYNSSTAEATIKEISIGSADADSVTDDFESYTAGAQFDGSDYVVKSSKDSTAPLDGTTLVANIINPASITDIDVDAVSGSNVLYLYDNNTGGKPIVSRAFTDGAAIRGSVTANLLIPSNVDAKAYMHLGTKDSASSSARFTEVEFGSSDIKHRDSSGSSSKGALMKYNRDQWYEITIAWDETSLTITIDGVVFTTFNEGTALTAENDTGSPTLFAIYVGSDGDTGDGVLVDDLDSELFE